MSCGAAGMWCPADVVCRAGGGSGTTMPWSEQRPWSIVSIWGGQGFRQDGQGWLRLMGAQVCCAAQVGDVPACWPMKWRVIRGKVLDGAQANCASCCCCVCCRCALLSARALRCAGLAGQIDGVARESLHVGTADNGTDWNGSRKTGNEVQCPDETGEVQRRSMMALV